MTPTATEHPTDDDVVAARAVRLRNALRLLESAQRAMHTSTAADLGLSVSELTALTAVNDIAELTPKMLALEIAFTTGAVTALLDRLDRAGLVTRSPNPLDRRSVLLTLTPRGGDLLAEYTARYDATVTEVLRSSPRLADIDVAEDLARAAAVVTARTIR